MKHLEKTIPLFLGAALAMAGCDATETPGTNPPTKGETTYPDDWAHAMPEDRGTATIHPEGTAGDGRDAHRMSIDQLRASIPQLFDGITWTVVFNRNEVVGFDLLSRTLGEADYIQTTSHNEDPSPLFAKFMDDMAADVCTKAIRADALAGPNDDKLVVVDANDPDATLRFLRLKLHGIYVPDGSTDGIEDLRTLHDDIVADTGNTDAAWLGVCMAMLTAPEFMAY